MGKAGGDVTCTQLPIAPQTWRDSQRNPTCIHLLCVYPCLHSHQFVHEPWWPKLTAHTWY